MLKMRRGNRPEVITGLVSGKVNSTEAACSLRYAGRLQRLHDRKKEVVIYDYADIEVPILVKMCRKRWLGDKSIGHDMTANPPMD